MDINVNGFILCIYILYKLRRLFLFLYVVFIVVCVVYCVFLFVDDFVYEFGVVVGVVGVLWGFWVVI